MHSASTIIGILCGLAAMAPVAAGAATHVDPQDFRTIERGRYLTIVGDCAACHTQAGSEHQFAGGRPIETPFGELRAPNITPDPQTGIGAWTDYEFFNALTTGTGRDGTRLYPAMPYTYMTKVSREDALAIRAYLNTLPAVRNDVKTNQLSFPFNMRWVMAVWDALFFEPAPFEPVHDKSAEWNRGAYLAEGLAHCGLCHTPKNFLGADKTGERLQGYALQGWFAPDITNDKRRGLGGWTVDDIAEYLKTGHNRTSAATGLMSETVSLSTSRMSEADLKAIAVYFKDQAGRQKDTQSDPKDATMTTGKSIYADECSGCHTPNGKGTPGMFPSINGSPVVQQTDPTTILRVVLRGARSVGTDKAPTVPAMPAFGWYLNDDQVAAVLTYVRNAWGNSAPPVDAGDVAKARKEFSQRSD